MSHEGREFDFAETFISDYGVIAKKNSDESGFDYFPTYGGPEEKYPAICVHCNSNIYIYTHIYIYYLYSYSKLPTSIYFS